MFRPLMITENDVYDNSFGGDQFVESTECVLYKCTAKYSDGTSCMCVESILAYVDVTINYPEISKKCLLVDFFCHERQ